MLLITWLTTPHHSPKSRSNIRTHPTLPRRQRIYRFLETGAALHEWLFDQFKIAGSCECVWKSALRNAMLWKSNLRPHSG